MAGAAPHQTARSRLAPPAPRRPRRLRSRLLGHPTTQFRVPERPPLQDQTPPHGRCFAASRPASRSSRSRSPSACAKHSPNATSPHSTQSYPSRSPPTKTLPVRYTAPSCSRASSPGSSARPRANSRRSPSHLQAPSSHRTRLQRGKVRRRVPTVRHRQRRSPAPRERAARRRRMHGGQHHPRRHRGAARAQLRAERHRRDGRTDDRSRSRDTRGRPHRMTGARAPADGLVTSPRRRRLRRRHAGTAPARSANSRRLACRARPKATISASDGAAQATSRPRSSSSRRQPATRAAASRSGKRRSSPANRRHGWRLRPPNSAPCPRQDANVGQPAAHSAADAPVTPSSSSSQSSPCS